MTNPLLATQRQKVLVLYKRLLRLGNSWTSANNSPKDTEVEQNYITSETKLLFRKNQNLTDSNEIANCIHEAQARMDLAHHYKTPYPRPVNVPPQAMAMRKGKELGVFQQRIKKQAQPIYNRSQVD